MLYDVYYIIMVFHRVRIGMGRNSPQIDFKRSYLYGRIPSGEIEETFNRVAMRLNAKPAPMAQQSRPERREPGFFETRVSFTSQKSWPEFIMITCGTAVVAMVAIDQLAGRPLTLSLLLLFLGGFLVGAGAKASICQIRHIDQSGETRIERWRPGRIALAVIWAGAGVSLFGLVCTGLTVLPH